jgi:hypothetical protein
MPLAFFNFINSFAEKRVQDLGYPLLVRCQHAFPLDGEAPSIIHFMPAGRTTLTPPGFVAPKWAKDFSLGRSPRNPRKSHQALKAFQKKLRAATERGRKLAFLRPDRAGRILDAFPGAECQRQPENDYGEFSIPE